MGRPTSLGLYLLPHLELDRGADHAARQRFARLFHSTLDQVPARPRNALVKFLRQRPGTVFILKWIPPRPGWDGQAWGTCRVLADRTELTFLRDVVAGADPEVVRALIAHELAHLYGHATGAHSWDKTVEEWLAERTAEGWGFGRPDAVPVAATATGPAEEEYPAADFGGTGAGRLAPGGTADLG